MTTITYIKAKNTEGLYDDEINPFESYDVVRVDQTKASIEFIKKHAADFVFETFSLGARDRRLNGWVRIDDEFGEYEATEHTVLIPVREMTDREIEDKLDEMADREVAELLDGAPTEAIRRRISNDFDRAWEAARDGAAIGE